MKITCQPCAFMCELDIICFKMLVPFLGTTSTLKHSIFINFKKLLLNYEISSFMHFQISTTFPVRAPLPPALEKPAVTGCGGASYLIFLLLRWPHYDLVSPHSHHLKFESGPIPACSNALQWLTTRPGIKPNFFAGSGPGSLWTLALGSSLHPRRAGVPVLLRPSGLIRLGFTALLCPGPIPPFVLSTSPSTPQNLFKVPPVTHFPKLPPPPFSFAAS